MPQWVVDLGEVVHWNDEELKNEVQSVVIEYNSENEFLCTISIGSHQRIRCREFRIVCLDEDNNQYEICDEVYLLSDEQLTQLKQYSFYWREKEPAKELFPTIAAAIERSFGLVLYYDKNVHSFVMAELQIDFIEDRLHEGKMTINIFSNETRMLVNQHLSYFVSFDFEFKEKKDNGLQRYTICGDNFLLTQAQAQKLCGLYNHKEAK